MTVNTLGVDHHYQLVSLLSHMHFLPLSRKITHSVSSKSSGNIRPSELHGYHLCMVLGSSKHRCMQMINIERSHTSLLVEAAVVPFFAVNYLNNFCYSGEWPIEC